MLAQLRLVRPRGQRLGLRVGLGPGLGQLEGEAFMGPALALGGDELQAAALDALLGRQVERGPAPFRHDGDDAVGDDGDAEIKIVTRIDQDLDVERTTNHGSKDGAKHQSM